MIWFLMAVGLLALLGIAGYMVLRKSVGHLAEQTRDTRLLEELDGGLAIPMRDSERPTTRQPTGERREAHPKAQDKVSR